MRVAASLIVVLALLGIGWHWYEHSSTNSVPERASTAATDEPVEAAAATGTATATPTSTEDSTQPLETDAKTELEHEAESFIETLTEVDPEPVSVESADHFVTSEQSLSLLPPDAIEHQTTESLLADESLDPDIPITAVKQIEQVENISPEKLIAESDGDLNKEIVVLEADQPITTTVKSVLEQRTENPDQPISLVKAVRYYEITTPRELETALDLTVQGEELIGIIRKPYRIEEATLADLLPREKLLDPEAIFYVRTGKSADVQGSWGIVQNGLISNFSRGVAIRRGEEVHTYQVELPLLADELQEDHSSSFLGRMIHRKTARSYVYNFRENRMGQNPHELTPGQEIVIIKFSPDELIAIYKHFVASSG